MVPYKLNHHYKISYPEKYFKRILTKYKIRYKHRSRVGVGLYELDFNIINTKIDFEVDGEQHFVDKRIVKHDIKRTKNLKKLGWKIIRVRWATFQRLNRDEREVFIEKLIKKLRRKRRRKLNASKDRNP